jgi:large subunit ribosomal protein L32
MAVPKRKKSKSRRNMRRGSNGSYALAIPKIIVDKETGEFRLAHNVGSDGVYRGRKIIADKVKKQKSEESSESTS